MTMARLKLQQSSGEHQVCSSSVDVTHALCHARPQQRHQRCRLRIQVMLLSQTESCAARGGRLPAWLALSPGHACDRSGDGAKGRPQLWWQSRQQGPIAGTISGAQAVEGDPEDRQHAERRTGDASEVGLGVGAETVAEAAGLGVKLAETPALPAMGQQS